ncbi:MAG: hypothetical protein ACYSSI_14725 [Planctomycetota bacterium]
MAAKRINVQCLEVEDKAGSLQALLEQIASANIDLQGFVACSKGSGSGCVCITAKDSAALEGFIAGKSIDATTAAGFVISGQDIIGAAGETLKGLADAGINGIAGAAMVCDGQYQMLIVVDTADGDAAEKALI